MARILHVDDDSSWRGIVKRALEEAGHQVVSLSTLPQAQQAYQAGGFDLVVCDGTLDKKASEAGVRWAEALHAQGQKTVVLSGWAKTEVPCVLKGLFDPEQLLALL